MIAENIDITKPEFRANPFPFYQELRENQPVYRTKLPDGRTAWLITRYEDVAAVLKDDRFAKDRRSAMTPQQLKKLPWIPPMFRALERNMLDLDAPDHTRLRALVHKGFTPRMIEQMRERVETLANELLDKVQMKGQMDLIKDYALPIPMTIISEMLGIPEKDRLKFAKWTHALLNASSNPNSITILPAMLSFVSYQRKLIKQRRANPQNDLISALVQAEEAGDALSEDELLAMVTILIIAGHETTVNLIASGTLALMQNREQMELLRNDPSLCKSAIEELVRYVCPVVEATERYAREDIAMHGTIIPRGDLVFAVLASANRDERQFANAEMLDIRRENNRHLGFGMGAHYCVGAPLARLEGQIALNTLLRRLPNIRLAVPESKLQWRPTLAVRGVETLPVVF